MSEALAVCRILLFLIRFLLVSQVHRHRHNVSEVEGFRPRALFNLGLKLLIDEDIE